MIETKCLTVHSAPINVAHLLIDQTIKRRKSAHSTVTSLCFGYNTNFFLQFCSEFFFFGSGLITHWNRQFCSVCVCNCNCMPMCQRMCMGLFVFWLCYATHNSNSSAPYLFHSFTHIRTTTSTHCAYTHTHTHITYQAKTKRAKKNRIGKFSQFKN